MRRTTSDDDARDGGFAFPARLAFPPVHPMQLLEIAGFSIGVAIVAERAAAMIQARRSVALMARTSFADCRELSRSARVSG